MILRAEAPVQRPEQHGEDWFCTWSIEGLSEEEPLIRVESGGVDPLQALLTALATMSERVHASGEGLRFLGAEDTQLPRATYLLGLAAE